jgi:hypothetical protein
MLPVGNLLGGNLLGDPDRLLGAPYILAGLLRLCYGSLL